MRLRSGAAAVAIATPRRFLVASAELTNAIQADTRNWPSARFAESVALDELKERCALPP